MFRTKKHHLLELRIKLHAESIPTRQAAKDFTPDEVLSTKISKTWRKGFALVFMVSLGIVS
eukprot:454839-Hanusia_phi.AAC.2